MTAAGPDRIEVEGIRAWGHHGVLPEEKQLGQEFVVDLALQLGTAPAARGDALQRTVNYALAAAEAQEEIRTGSHDLIETLAERIAARVLQGSGAPHVRALEVTVHKPAAPVGIPVADVRMRIHRRAAPVEAVLALGTNLGDRERILREALAGLREAPSVRVDWTAPVVETDPVGGPGGQEAFLNTVVGLRCELAPFALLELAQRLEQEAGRERTVRWGPRTLDIDLLTYGTFRTDDPELTLPHPRAQDRAFVLAPWSAARPEAVLPGHGNVRELLALAADREGVRPGPPIDGFDRP